MTEPIINQINNIAKIDDTSDIAGAAAVTPSYIASDVPADIQVNGAVGIDSVEVSNGVSTSQVSLSGSVEKEESSNYIQSDVSSDTSISEADKLDGFDMNSLAEVSGAAKYVDPSAPEVQLILMSLKDSGIISSSMSEEEMVIAINKYVGSSYSYIADSGDKWSSVSHTIKNGGGDCEDLANLEASLITAALMDRGLSLVDADKKISLVVAANLDTGMGHVYVQYTQDNGSIKYLDPVASAVTSAINSSLSVLFSYDAEGVNVINKGFDYSKLDTAEYTVPVQDTGSGNTNFLAIDELMMEESAPDVISTLQNLLNTLSWSGYCNLDAMGLGSYYNDIFYFLNSLEANKVPDTETVQAIYNELGVISTKLNGLTASLDAQIASAQAASDVAYAQIQSFINGLSDIKLKTYYSWNYVFCLMDGRRIDDATLKGIGSIERFRQCFTYLGQIPTASLTDAQILSSNLMDISYYDGNGGWYGWHDLGYMTVGDLIAANNNQTFAPLYAAYYSAKSLYDALSGAKAYYQTSIDNSISSVKSAISKLGPYLDYSKAYSSAADCAFMKVNNIVVYLQSQLDMKAFSPELIQALTDLINTVNGALGGWSAIEGGTLPDSVDNNANVWNNFLDGMSHIVPHDTISYYSPGAGMLDLCSNLLNAVLVDERLIVSGTGGTAKIDADNKVQSALQAMPSNTPDQQAIKQAALNALHSGGDAFGSTGTSYYNDINSLITSLRAGGIQDLLTLHNYHQKLDGLLADLNGMIAKDVSVKAKYDADVICRNSLNAAIAKLDTYSNISKTYYLSLSPTNSYMESMLSFMGASEYRAGQLNWEVAQLSDTAGLLNAQAAMEVAQAIFDSSLSGICYTNTASVSQSAWAYIYNSTDMFNLWPATLDNFKTKNPDFWNYYQSMTSGGVYWKGIPSNHAPNMYLWDFLEKFCGWSESQCISCFGQANGYVFNPIIGLRQFVSAVQAYMQWQTAISTADSIQNQYVLTYILNTNKSFDDVLNEFKSKYLSQDKTTGFWNINWAKTDFDPDKPDSKLNEARVLKGYLTASSLIYEAKRDLRKHVEEELDGEGDGLKGMPINKLFMKKVDKVEAYIQQTIMNILNTMKNLNQAHAIELISAINNKYDEEAQRIQGNTPGACGDDNREEDLLKNENRRLAEINTVNGQMKAVEERNMVVTKNMLAATGANITGITGNEIWDSINKEITNTLNSISSLERYTLSSADDPAYKEVDRNLAISLRARLNGAIQIRRIALMASQAMSDMRNLVHQEMTGIGGREARTDAAAEFVESDSQKVMTWFDEVVSSVEEKVKLSNQIRYNQLQIQKNQEMINEIESQKSKMSWAKGLSWAAMVFTIGAMIPGLQLLVIVAIVLATASAALKASANKDIAERRAELEEEYRIQVIKPTDDPYKPQTVDFNGNTEDNNANNNENPGNNNSNAGRDALQTIMNIAWKSENAIENILGNMTDDNYLTIMNDGDGYRGSSAVDAVKFARAKEDIRNNDMMLLIAESARKTMAETRNLVHMEMTSIGGRTPSNMVTYAMEAARGQQAFIASEMYQYISDMNTSNNQRYESDRKLRLYRQIADSAGTAFAWSCVPVIGAMVGNSYESMTDLNHQKDQLEATARENFVTDSRLDEPDLNVLINGRLINTGNDTVGVDYQKIADARTAEAKQFIQTSIEASIMKVLRQLRSIAHMEMTSIQSSTGQDIADEANIMNFQTAVECISLITDYLSQKAIIQNKVTDAKKQIDNLNQQIATLTGGIVFSGATFLAMVAFGFSGGWATLGTTTTARVLAALDIVQFASTVSNFVLGVFQTINKWIDAGFKKSMANDDMGEVGAYLQAKEIMDSSINSTTSKLEDLEQKCIDEINANLLQDLGAGFIGVNRGLALQYKALIEQLYKAERKKSEVQKALQELRNAVHEILNGISGASINATLAILGIKEQDIKAKIDDMFGKLEVAVARWNQISEAQRAAEVAEIEKEMATAMTIIEGVILAFEAYARYSKAPQTEKTEMEKLGNDKVKITDELENPDSKLSIAAKANKALQARTLYITLALKATEILTKLAFAQIEKEAMKGVQSRREGRVSSLGVTKTEKNSNVVSQNGAFTGDFESFSANQQAVYGQMGLNDQKATYALKSMDIENDFKENMYKISEDAIEYGKSIAESGARMLSAKLKEKNEQFWINRDKLEKQLKEAGLKPAQIKAVMKAYDSAVKDIDQATDPATLRTKVQAAVQQIQKGLNGLEAFRPSEQQAQSNTSPLAQRLEQMLKLSSESTETIKELETKVVPAMESDVASVKAQLVAAKAANKPADVKELQEVLKQLNAKLAVAKTALTAAKAEKGKLEKTIEVLKVKIAEMEVSIKGEKDKLSSELKGLQEQLDELDKLVNKQGSNKDAVEQMMAKIRSDIKSKLAQYEVLKAKYELKNGELTVLCSEIEGTNKKIEERKNDIVKIQREIEIVKAQIKEGKRGDQQNGNGPINFQTPMTIPVPAR